MRDYPISLLLIHVVILLVAEILALSYEPRQITTQSPLQLSTTFRDTIPVVSTV
jgi:hypothetical protein